MKTDDLRTYLANPMARLPERMPLTRLCAQIAESHEREGGATVNPRFGSLIGQPLFAVSLYPGRSVIVAGRSLAAELIAVFVRQNSDLLRDPRNSIGTWYDEEADVTYLDITAVVVEKREGLTLGDVYNQKGIYDLEEGEEIPTGGTGKEPEEAPPEIDRLPPLKRRHRKGNDDPSR